MSRNGKTLKFRAAKLKGFTVSVTEAGIKRLVANYINRELYSAVIFCDVTSRIPDVTSAIVLKAKQNNSSINLGYTQSFLYFYDRFAHNLKLKDVLYHMSLV